MEVKAFKHCGYTRGGAWTQGYHRLISIPVNYSLSCQLNNSSVTQWFDCWIWTWKTNFHIHSASLSPSIVVRLKYYSELFGGKKQHAGIINKWDQQQNFALWPKGSISVPGSSQAFCPGMAFTLFRFSFPYLTAHAVATEHAWSS